MERTQFAEGAMRRCFRMVKETQAPGVSEAWRHDWHHASAYVAKEYKDKAVGTREAYERDCRVRHLAQYLGRHPSSPFSCAPCRCSRTPSCGASALTH